MALKDILTSIHGRKLGLDSSGNLVVNGPSGQAVLASGITAGSTSATNPSFGFLSLTSAPVGYTLDDPTPGQRLTILTQSQTTATGRFVQTSTANGVTMGSSGAYNKWSSTAAHSLELVGLSTSVWGVIGNNLASTVSTSYGSFSTI